MQSLMQQMMENPQLMQNTLNAPYMQGMMQVNIHSFILFYFILFYFILFYFILFHFILFHFISFC